MKDFYGLIIIIMLLGLAAEFISWQNRDEIRLWARRRFWSTRQYSWTGE